MSDLIDPEYDWAPPSLNNNSYKYSLNRIIFVHAEVVVDSKGSRSYGVGHDLAIDTHADVQVLPDVAVRLFQRPTGWYEKVTPAAEAR